MNKKERDAIESLYWDGHISEHALELLCSVDRRLHERIKSQKAAADARENREVDKYGPRHALLSKKTKQEMDRGASLTTLRPEAAKRKPARRKD